jgi:leucyl aminopeptidase
MDFILATTSVSTTQADSLILPLAQDQSLNDEMRALDLLLDGAISRAIDSGDLSGAFKRHHLFLNAKQQGPRRILVIGTGEPDQLTAHSYRQLLKTAWSLIHQNPASSIHNHLTAAQSASLDAATRMRLAIETLTEASYAFQQFKHHPIQQAGAPITMQLSHTTADAQQHLDLGVATARAMDLCRNLGNLPGNICTPSYLAEQAQQLATASTKVNTQVLDEADMAQLGMHCLLSVGQGSAEPSRLIVVDYQGGDKTEQPHVLIGKGVTFDSGGISLKPGANMDEMKYDMCGAASVLSTLQAVIELELPINVVAVVASAENMPSSTASKPGDIVTTMSGQTVEILNTDAEGRLVLCDALTYVARFKPATVVDVATLTGACVIALGHHTTALLSNNDAFASQLLAAGQQANDPVWQLPLGEVYQAQLDSNFADMANIGGRPAGTITAACFLSRFAQQYTWAHLDIAGTAWTSGKHKGASGRCVPLLVQHLVNQTNLAAADNP